jgi:hypothetical protein
LHKQKVGRPQALAHRLEVLVTMSVARNIHFHSARRRVRRRHAFGFAERRVLDATGALKAKTAWTYNPRNQVLTTTATDPSATPNAARITTSTHCEQVDVTAGTCPLVGLLKSIDGPRTVAPNDLATYTYWQTDDPACATAPTTCAYRKGDLKRVTNALGHFTETLAYDGAKEC